MSYFPEYARLIDKALLRLDRSPSWLAQRLGVHPSTVSRWLNQGARPRNPETVARVADVLGVAASRSELLAAAGYAYQETSPTAKDRPRHNLPVQLTPLIGREDELVDIATLLAAPDCRLLTVWGLGGIGKTRLALAAAEAQLGSPLFPDGVFWAPLVSISRPDQIAPALASALNFPLDFGDKRRTPQQQLLDFLRNKRLLLVLDNLEHLPQMAGLTTEILQSAADVRILATSREHLRLPGEQLFPLNGLAYPTQESSEDVYCFDAPQLFLDRARHCLPDFAVDNADVDNLVQICRVVDGMPLAIELAAAWIDTLSLREISQELATSIAFLTVNAPGVAARHRSMEAAFGASWQRLTAEEQQVFTRLSVFRGGFTRSAAEQVSDATLQTLGALVGKSFVRFDPAQGRYEIHELLRQFGDAKLASSNEDESCTHGRHAVFFAALVKQFQEKLKSKTQQDALALLLTERGNLQVAWEWMVSRQMVDPLERTMDGLGRFFEWIGSTSEAAALFGMLATNPAYSTGSHRRRIQAKALAWSANFELMLGKTRVAEERLQQSLATLDELSEHGEETRRARALAFLHWGHLEMLRDLEAAALVYAQSCALYEEIGLDWEAAFVRVWWGHCRRLVGEYVEAIDLLQRARTTMEACGDQRCLAMTVEALAHVYLRSVDLEKSLELIKESLRLRRGSGDRLGIANSLTQLASTYTWFNRAEVELLDEALAIVQDLGHRSAECMVYFVAKTVHKYRGEMDKREEVIEKGLALARELDDTWQIGNFTVSQGNQAMLRGDYTLAHRLISQGLDEHTKLGIQQIMPWRLICGAYAGWKAGDHAAAQERIVSALRASVERSDRSTAVWSLFILAQVLASTGETERAAELGALAQRENRWTNNELVNRLFVDPVEAMMAQHPTEVTDRAYTKGQTLELFETAALLLEEVQSPDWTWA